MTPLKPLVQAAIAKDLSEFTPRQGGGYCAVWEKRTLNMHRGIVLLERPGDVDASSLLNEIRETIASEFNLTWAWLRGFAFGVVVSSSRIPANVEQLANCVDRYNRSRGVFQWLVLVTEHPRTAFGIHMWAEGYLSPTFRRLVQLLRDADYDCPTFTDDKGPFFEFASAIRRLPVGEFQQGA